ncbi:F-box/LRR-repeat protein 20-like [Anastrepha ludens]|uniref:F-box/LRR-repeat protein 20-like n=1 Tax=Anastrepha ludens TaxID=28586 RepID=UPI0023AFD4C4|nr:F-box/LRR-repeat protein 20-like [Anastrepha ludens]
MACLRDLIKSSLRSGSKAKITTLYRYIFESEGDRSNRQRLREFCGFAYNEGSAEFEVKSQYVDANLNERDLVTICNVLGIDYNKGHLLVASDAENHDDDDDGVGSEDEAANSYDGAEQRACSTLRNRRNNDCFFSIDGNEGRKEAHKTAERRERRRICDEREASISASEANENEMPMQMSRFAINFRDIEDSVRPFDGTDKLPIDVWVNEFEETATLMRWDEFQKFVFAKKSLKGLARMFILSERGITSWCKLKKALIDEFQAVFIKRLTVIVILLLCSFSSLIAVHSLPHLTVLSLSGCSKLTDDGVELIAENLQKLRALDLSWCPRITDASLEYIACDLNQLEELTLDRCVHITDIGVGYISTMLSLTALFLRWCSQVRDFGLQHLCSMRNLQVLSLAGCPLLTSSGLSSLIQLRHLQELELTNCPGASHELFDYLKEHLPRCLIIE